MAKTAVTLIGGGDGYDRGIIYTATADPNSANDASAGHMVGDIVLNTSTGVQWLCVDNTTGAAVWIIRPRVFTGSAIPTGTTGPNGGTGSWKIGDVILNTGPAVAGTGGSQYVVYAWLRLTNGTANVLNTDWVAMRTLTGT